MFILLSPPLGRKKRFTATLVVQRLAPLARGQSGAIHAVGKARWTVTLADQLALGHDVSRAQDVGRSREERVHAVIAFQERHVGCLVAVLHDGVGNGKSCHPSGRQPSEIATAGAASRARAAAPVRTPTAAEATKR
jgi:hypothetical protein